MESAEHVSGEIDLEPFYRPSHPRGLYSLNIGAIGSANVSRGHHSNRERLGSAGGSGSSSSTDKSTIRPAGVFCFSHILPSRYRR
jgi:hypothetical protein